MHDTAGKMERAWKKFLWSLDVLASGLEPSFDEDQKPFTANSSEGQRAHQHIATSDDGRPWAAIMIFFKGDLEFWSIEVRQI